VIYDLNSIPPDKRIALLMTDPLISSDQRLRRLAPRMSWVAFTDAAKRARADAMSLPLSNYGAAFGQRQNGQ